MRRNPVSIPYNSTTAQDLMRNQYLSFEQDVAVALHIVGILLGISNIMTMYDLVGLVVLSFLSSSMYVWVSMKNPGKLKERSEEYKRKVFFKGGRYLVLEDEGSIVGRMVEIDKVSKFEIFCTTCGIFRPSGTSHCRECKACIYNMDHHCPWIGNCVGGGNYQDFLFFLTLESITGMFFLSLAIRKRPLSEFSLELSKIALYVPFLLMFLLTMIAVSLWIYFIFLLVSGKTARTFCKERNMKIQLGKDEEKRKIFNEDRTEEITE